MAEFIEENEKVIFANQPKLFGKWNYDELQVSDLCFKDYVAVSTTKSQIYVPHTAGRYQAKRFRKSLCPIVERLVGSLQFHGRNTGKKAQAIRIVRSAFEIIHLMTGVNPIQILIDAIQNGGAREDSTRIGSGGVVRKQAVDVSPLRRVNQAIYFMAKIARDHAMKTSKTVAECLADEIINCGKNNAQGSGTLRKKDDIEKSAKTNR